MLKNLQSRQAGLWMLWIGTGFCADLTARNESTDVLLLTDIIGSMDPSCTWDKCQDQVLSCKNDDQCSAHINCGGASLLDIKIGEPPSMLPCLANVQVDEMMKSELKVFSCAIKKGCLKLKPTHGEDDSIKKPKSQHSHARSQMVRRQVDADGEIKVVDDSEVTLMKSNGTREGEGRALCDSYVCKEYKGVCRGYRLVEYCREEPSGLHNCYDARCVIDGRSRRCNKKACGCFPRDASVQLSTGAKLQLHELRSGDLVATVDPVTRQIQYEKYLGDFHSEREHQMEIPYLRIIHESGSLNVSASHYIHTADHGFMPAREVRVGDRLLVWHGQNPAASLSKVVAVSPHKKLGMYAPFTFSGTLLVDGVFASSYTSDEFDQMLSPRVQERLLDVLGGHHGVNHLMHALALPLRLAHYTGLPGFFQHAAKVSVPGADFLSKFLAAGPHASPRAAAPEDEDEDLPLYVKWVGRVVSSSLEMVI